MRATGTTFRYCLRATLYASEGRKVLFVYGNSLELSLLRSEIIDIVRGRGTWIRPNTVEFGSGGLVDLRRASDNYHGLRYDIHIEDELLGMNWREIQAYRYNTQCILKG